MTSVAEFPYLLQKSICPCIKVSIVKKIETTLLFFQVPKPEKSQVLPKKLNIIRMHFDFIGRTGQNMLLLYTIYF